MHGHLIATLMARETTQRLLTEAPLDRRPRPRLRRAPIR
jgi:hypothetical protein